MYSSQHQVGVPSYPGNCYPYGMPQADWNTSNQYGNMMKPQMFSPRGPVREEHLYYPNESYNYPSLRVGHYEEQQMGYSQGMAMVPPAGYPQDSRGRYGGGTSRAPMTPRGGASTGGSNAQGRAINKLLLDILRERVVDPHKLDQAIETYTERMDCVNLATLLFHTGKKRLLLNPGYIRRIAVRFSLLKEELRAREASNALYGLKCMSSELPEARELIVAVANKVANSSSEFVAQAVGNALYGCQMMTTDHDEVRYLLVVLAGKVAQCTELLEAQNIGNALYGMRGMNSDYKEVRALLGALTPKIATAREELNGQALGNSLYGLQCMSCKEIEVRKLLQVLAAKVSRTWEELKAQEVGNALYGLKRMSTDVPEVRLLIGALIPKIASSPELLDAQAIGNSFYGMQNMTSDSTEILSLLGVMAEKVSLSSPELDGQAMGNSIYGLQGMSSNYPEVREVVAALTLKVSNSCLEMNAQELGNALFGLQSMSSDHPEVRRLVVALTVKVNSSKYELASQEIGNALFGVQGMSSMFAETRDLIRALTYKIQQSHAVLDPQGIANSLLGMQQMSSDSIEMKDLIAALALRIEYSWKIMSAQQLSDTLYGMQHFSSHEKEVRLLLKIIAPKIASCREELTPTQMSRAFFGLQNMSSEHPEVLTAITNLAEKISLSTATWSLRNLSIVIFSMQGLNSNVQEVQLLLSMLSKLLLDSSVDQDFDGDTVSNLFFGLQRMDCSCSEVLKIFSVLNSLLTKLIQNGVSLSAVQAANILLGMQSCNYISETEEGIFSLLTDSLMKMVDFFRYLHANNYSIDVMSNKQDTFNEFLALHQALLIINYGVCQSGVRPELQQRGKLVEDALERLLCEYQQEYKPPLLTSAESNLYRELSQRLVDEPIRVIPQTIVSGMPCALLLQLSPDAELKTIDGNVWSPSLVVEVKGSSYTFPAKQLLYHNKHKVLREKCAIHVELLPADSFHYEGCGLRYHPALLNPFFPPSVEDANYFASELSSRGLCGPMGILSTVKLNDESHISHSSSMNNLKGYRSNLSGSPVSINSQYAAQYPTLMSASYDSYNTGRYSLEYRDDDYERASAFAECIKLSCVSPFYQSMRIIGFPYGWLGKFFDIGRSKIGISGVKAFEVNEKKFIADDDFSIANLGNLPPTLPVALGGIPRKDRVDQGSAYSRAFKIESEQSRVPPLLNISGVLLNRPKLIKSLSIDDDSIDERTTVDTILTSRTYQSSLMSNSSNSFDQYHPQLFPSNFTPTSASAAVANRGFHFGFSDASILASKQGSLEAQSLDSLHQRHLSDPLHYPPTTGTPLVPLKCGSTDSPRGSQEPTPRSESALIRRLSSKSLSDRISENMISADSIEEMDHDNGAAIDALAGSDDSVVDDDDEIALLEAKLEVARLEAKIKALKVKKVKERNMKSDSASLSFSLDSRSVEFDESISCSRDLLASVDFEEQFQLQRAGSSPGASKQENVTASH